MRVYTYYIDIRRNMIDIEHLKAISYLKQEQFIQHNNYIVIYLLFRCRKSVL